MLDLLQVHTAIQEALILCTVSEDAHASISTTSLGDEAYLEYERALQEVLLPLSARPALSNKSASMSTQLLFYTELQVSVLCLFHSGRKQKVINDRKILESKAEGRILTEPQRRAHQSVG